MTHNCLSCFFQIICLLFTPILFVPAIILLFLYVVYHRCYRCCRPWARSTDLPRKDPWRNRLDLSSPRSIWSGLTTSSTLSQNPQSARDLFSRDPETLLGLRALLDEEVRAAFSRLGDSFENPSFVPPLQESGVTTVVVENESGGRRNGDEEINSIQQEY
jgi:hypothetical protein